MTQKNGVWSKTKHAWADAEQAIVRASKDLKATATEVAEAVQAQPETLVKAARKELRRVRTAVATAQQSRLEWLAHQLNLATTRDLAKLKRELSKLNRPTARPSAPRAAHAAN